MAEQLAEYLVGVDEFLEWESQQPTKYELIDNRIYPLTGASRSHNFISVKLATALDRRLSGRGCEVYTSAMRMQVHDAGTYTYPDVVVACAEPRLRQYVTQDTLLNPTLLFEILSPSTELIDRNQKYKQYLQIPSLTGYFLVAQTKPLIQSYLRIGEDWMYRAASGLEATLVIKALDCEIPLSEIYQQMRKAGA